MSGAPGRQPPDEALELFGAQYRRMMQDNLRQMLAEFDPPKE
jgi:hypothetical protein